MDIDDEIQEEQVLKEVQWRRYVHVAVQGGETALVEAAKSAHKRHATI